MFGKNLTKINFLTLFINSQSSAGLDTQINMVGASGSITPDGRGKTMRPAFKRSVTWADGTAEPKQVDLAISIPRYKNNKEGGYTEYCLEVYHFCVNSCVFFNVFCGYSCGRQDGRGQFGEDTKISNPFTMT